jgi:hypothetical protein
MFLLIFYREIAGLLLKYRKLYKHCALCIMQFHSSRYISRILNQEIHRGTIFFTVGKKYMKKDKRPHTTENKKKNNPQPLQKEDIQKNPDERIDEDFPGYPHPPSNEKMINPVTEQEKTNAQLIGKKNEKKEGTEQQSDGSADAFSRTEGDVLRGELENNEQKKKENNY